MLDFLFINEAIFFVRCFTFNITIFLQMPTRYSLQKLFPKAPYLTYKYQNDPPFLKALPHRFCIVVDLVD